MRATKVLNFYKIDMCLNNYLSLFSNCFAKIFLIYDVDPPPYGNYIIINYGQILRRLRYENWIRIFRMICFQVTIEHSHMNISEGTRLLRYLVRGMATRLLK